ncbi:hypothetical protein EOL94_03145 [bacterium]|nr:hypothetical protein [bacterium]
MFNPSRIENFRSSFENTGFRLESEFLGNIDKTKYNQLACEYLFGNPANNEDDPEKKFIETIKFREQAEKMFHDTEAISDKAKYIDFKSSMKLVEDSQISDPENPKKFFAKKLLDALKDRFDDKYVIKFFTAAGGTHLDVKHKVDCFFKVYNRENEEELCFATIDLTSNPKKKDCKADVLINISSEDKDKFDDSKNNEDFNENFVEEKISEYADRIANALIENYKNS